MPELPEVETTIRGIKPHLEHNVIYKIIVRQPKLRWMIPTEIHENAEGKTINQIVRRGKYIIFRLDNGSIIMHLGMSGRVRIIDGETTAEKHDHVDIVLTNKTVLRYTDPRRFGSILWDDKDGLEHPLISKLGVEPLSEEFTGEYLHNQALRRSLAIKAFIMDSKVVVGVGNIYATEALFTSNIHPLTPANQVTLKQMQALVSEIKSTLKVAITQGGTTLKDFLGSDGKPGYFVQKLKAYGRAGQDCFNCKTALELLQIGQRASVFCPRCQAMP